MAVSLEKKLNEVGDKRRRKIEARAAELIAEERSLRALRKERRARE